MIGRADTERLKENMNNEIPRRIRLDLMTPEELAIFNMVGKIEELGAHPLLTDCIVLLGEARSKLSDWVDSQAAQKSKRLNGVVVCLHTNIVGDPYGSHCIDCGMANPL